MSCEKDVPLSQKLFEFCIILEDGQWHSISEIAEEIHVNVDKLKKACDLLTEFELIEREGDRIKGKAILVSSEC